MPFARLNGIEIHYEVLGSGPPVLMLAPGGFDSTIDKWSTTTVWSQVMPLELLSKQYTCIAYDRRESGRSGGRVERLSWQLYAAEAKELLDHVGIERAVVMGGCMGCTVAIAFGVEYPDRVSGLVLHWPVGGHRWRLDMRGRFQKHLDFVRENGLEAVVREARKKKVGFLVEPSLGPWAPVLVSDEFFAKNYVSQDQDHYVSMVRSIGLSMFDRDSAPGAEAEELIALKSPALIIPGDDAAHATSASRYLQECLPNNVYCEGPLEGQTPRQLEDWIMGFLADLTG